MERAGNVQVFLNLLNVEKKQTRNSPRCIMPLSLCQLGYSSTTIALKILGGLFSYIFVVEEFSRDLHRKK